MIALDTNLLVYSHRRDSPLFAVARELVAQLAEGSRSWAIPWPCLHEFFGVTTNTRLWRNPTPPARALDVIDDWLRSPTLHVLHEAESHWSRLSTLVADSGVSGPAIHDARIAAICLEHGVSEFWTADRDFGRFQALKTRNPLVR